MTIFKTASLAIVAIGFAAAVPVFAQDAPGTVPQTEPPAMNPDMGQMMEGGGNMMGMMNMMTQMNEMMSACTKMMQAMTPKAPMEEAAPSTPR